MTRGALTPPPTWKNPPPTPPPRPSPTPGPVPTPTPPPEPDPIPPPEPVPFEGGPEGRCDIGSPRFGKLLEAIFTCGGMTTVGSAVSLGLSLRTTTMGGVICSIDCLGNFPLGAWNLSRSPPPPPPPACVLEGSSGGISSGEIRVTVSCGLTTSLITLRPQSVTQIIITSIRTCATVEPSAPFFL